MSTPGSHRTTCCSQARLIARDLEALGRPRPVVARYPDYTAARWAAGRAAEPAGDVVAAYASYRRVASAQPVALDRAAQLHAPAVAAVAAQVEDAIARSRLDEARQRLATLLEWAPSDQATLEASMGFARASSDPRAELQGRGLLDSARSAERRARAAASRARAGQASAAIAWSRPWRADIPTSRVTPSSRAANSAAGANLPAEVAAWWRPELSRAELAVLLYCWCRACGVGGERPQSPATPRSPRRQEIRRVVNLR